MSSLIGNIYVSRDKRLMEAGMGENCGGNWALFWWAGPYSVTFNPIFCWLGATVFPPCCLTSDQTMEIKPVNPKANPSWIFNGRTDAESPILWPPVAKNPLIGKDPDAGKDWRQEEKGTTEDEMVGWHYWLNGHEFEQTLGDSEGKGRLHATVHGVTKYAT